MEENKNNKEVIDLREVFKELLANKKRFIIVWVIVFIVSCLIIFPVPRTYMASVTVAPESSEANSGTLSSIASSFGFNVGNITSTDAFYPDIYPDVIASNEFIADLMNIKVETSDGGIKTDYYTYLTKYQKVTPYMIPFAWVKKQVKTLFDEDKKNKTNNTKQNKINIFQLTEKQTMLFEAVRNMVSCSVDKKTGIISINVVDQDPLICATIADSARVHLQNFITHYRTAKARTDCEYYTKLMKEAKADYEASMNAYSKYCDSHVNSLLQTELSERDALENDMSLKLNTYNTLNNQLALAKAKVQESTPAFSLLQGATVPVKAKGPKRMLFVIGMLFLSTLGTIGYIFKRDILSNLYKRN